MALWIAAGANPKEVAVRAGHASVSFTLDRYGHPFPEADLLLRDRLEMLRATGHVARCGPGMIPTRTARRVMGPTLVGVAGLEPAASSL